MADRTYMQQLDGYAPVEVESVVGKTVEAVGWSEVEGQHGDEPCVTLYFTDKTRCGFVLPREGD